MASLADAAYKPPIRMYYGTTDPNYTTGARAQLDAQWSRLGVAWEEDVQEGYGHNTWPNASMADGFRFLAAHARPDRRRPAARLPRRALCLNRGRFRVEVAWEADGASGSGRAVPGASADSGLFWFFGPDNWELMVKVLDGCALNGRYWVFSAAHHRRPLRADGDRHRRPAASTVRYENPAGKPAAATTDIGAFPTCP